MYAQRLKYLTFEQNFFVFKAPKETDFFAMWILYVSGAFIHQLHKTN